MTTALWAMVPPASATELAGAGIGGSASPIAGGHGSVGLQPGGVAVTRPGTISPGALWTATLSTAQRQSNGGLPGTAPPAVANRGGSGRLPAAGGSRRGSTSTPRWRDADGGVVPGIAAAGDVGGICSPQCPASAYTPRPPGITPPMVLSATCSPRTQSPRNISPGPGAPPLLTATPAAMDPQQRSIATRLSDLERLMRDLRSDMDRNHNEASQEINRLSVTVQELDVESTAVSDLAAEVAELRQQIQCPPVSTLNDGDLEILKALIKKAKDDTICIKTENDGSGQKSISDGVEVSSASTSISAQGNICEVVRTALSELERLSRLASEGLEAVVTERKSDRKAHPADAETQELEAMPRQLEQSETLQTSQKPQAPADSSLAESAKAATWCNAEMSAEQATKPKDFNAAIRVEGVPTPLGRPGGVTLTAVPIPHHAALAPSGTPPQGSSSCNAAGGSFTGNLAAGPAARSGPPRAASPKSGPPRAASPQNATTAGPAFGPLPATLQHGVSGRHSPRIKRGYQESRDIKEISRDINQELRRSQEWGKTMSCVTAPPVDGESSGPSSATSPRCTPVLDNRELLSLCTSMSVAGSACSTVTLPEAPSLLSASPSAGGLLNRAAPTSAPAMAAQANWAAAAGVPVITVTARS